MKRSAATTPQTWPVTMMLLGGTLLFSPLAHGFATVQKEYLAGYLIVPIEGNVDRSYGAGFSIYVAAWPLQRHYPGHRFQTGLPGTWMFAQYNREVPKDFYSDVEGGLGWWRDTRFPSETPKFVMGGVGPNFSEIANGPGQGSGTWADPKGLYGVAQISPWLLFPPDGLNLAQGTCGQLFGYGYFALPLSFAKKTTNGKPVPTGEQSWTLFLNTRNFKGPVAFFTPNFWSRAGLRDSRVAGQLLDNRPADPNRQVQMETQYIPCQVSTDSKGDSYARIAPTSFPRQPDGSSLLIHQDTAYDRRALWNSVETWFAGGAISTGRINPAGAHVREFGKGGYSTWEIRTPNPDGTEGKIPIDWNSFATPATFDSQTYGFTWNFGLASKATTPGAKLVTLPQYFHLKHGAGDEPGKWIPIGSDQVPTETGLQRLKFDRPTEPPQEAFATPTELTSPWQTPGPRRGPFRARLGDGTVVTYYWYRFADQPALLNSDLTPQERELMQLKVEKIHRSWPKDHDYIAPPKVGTLASIDPALIVKPPKGLEIGYVPVATRQELFVKDGKNSR